MASSRTESKDSRARAPVGATQRTVLVSVLATLAVTVVLTVLEVWSGIWDGKGHGIISTLSSSSALEKRTHTCDNGRRALVYNKAPKTASTFIQAVLENWTVATGRPLYRCYQTPMLAMANIRACLPEAADACGVFSSHVFLNQYTLDLFAERLPSSVLMTSTRYPAHRIVSMFLFTRKLRDDDPGVEQGLTSYVRNLNPWGLYNYHTGEFRSGSCPLTENESRMVWAAVMKFDVVIDVNSFRASNAILKHHGLFGLPEVAVEDRRKERGAVRVKITAEIRSLLREKVCVEEELHRAFQIKMSRLYEDATGEECLFNAKISKLDSCIVREEAESLGDFWKLET